MIILESLDIISISNTIIRELLSLLDNNLFNKAETKQTSIFYLEIMMRKQYQVLQ